MRPATGRARRKVTLLRNEHEPGPVSGTKKVTLRLTHPDPSETEFAEAVVRYLTLTVLPPAKWTCFPAGIVPLPRMHAAKLARMGLQRGWPDYLILHQRLYGLELKTAAGRLSKSYLARTAKGGVVWREGQEDVFPALVAAGMTIAICRTLDDVVAALEAWDIPRRGTR